MRNTLFIAALGLLLTGCVSTKPTERTEVPTWTRPFPSSASVTNADPVEPVHRETNGTNVSSVEDASAAALESGRRRAAVTKSVNQWLGTPYRFGGTGRSGVDCSAFVQAVFREALDLGLPRTTDAQRESGTIVSPETIGFGDLVFFNITSRQRHVGVVVGEGEFAHASSSSGVTVSRLSDPYWSRRFDRAVRFDPLIAEADVSRATPAPQRPAVVRRTEPANPDRAAGASGRRRGW